MSIRFTYGRHRSFWTDIVSPVNVVTSLLFALPVLLAAPAVAQDADGPFPFLNQQPTAPTADADPAQALANALRVLGDSPNDVRALEIAGRAALECGDPSSSIGFWARADKLEPGSGTVKAGLAAALVQAEEPKRALQLFEQAVTAGVPETQIAGDRGLANDLLGNNRKAQADYRLALRAHEDPEVSRRLALSLAISGDRAPALATLDPLLRKQDMGAWRARAFVLALTGNLAEANSVARQVLSPAQASQLAPFLARLAALPHPQQAAAVTFGDMPTSGRPTTTLMLASTNRPAAPSATRPMPDPSHLAPTPMLPYQLAQRPMATSVSTGARLSTSPPGTQLRVATGAVDFAGRPIATPGPASRPAAATPEVTTATMLPTAPVTVALTSTALPPRPAPLPAPAGSSAAVAASAKIPPASPRQIVQADPDRPVKAPPLQLAADTLGAEAVAVGARPVFISPPPPRLQRTSGPVATTDSLSDAPIASHATTRPRETELASAAARTVRSSSGRASPDPSKLAGRDGPKPRDDDGASVSVKAHGKNAEMSATLLDRDKSKSVKSAAEARARTEADRKDKAAAKAAPSRIWVQVQGGANKHDLGKAWDKLKKAAPELYAGREPSTVPVRFTNRLLVGPFKSDDEAQAYVNRLTKGGQSGFIVKTESGQKVEKMSPGD